VSLDRVRWLCADTRHHFGAIAEKEVMYDVQPAGSVESAIRVDRVVAGRDDGCRS